MQAPLVDVVALGVVPVLLGGEEPLEEVDALESLLLVLAHDFSSPRLVFAVSIDFGADADSGAQADREELAKLDLALLLGETQVVVRVRGLFDLDDLVDPDHHLGRDVVELDRHRHDEAVREIDRRQDHRIEPDARAALGVLALDAEPLERPGVLFDVGLVAGEQLEEQRQPALGAADPVEIDRALDQRALLRLGPVEIERERRPAGQPVEELDRRDVRVVEPPAVGEVPLDRVEHVLEHEAQVADEVAADRIGAAVDRRQVLEVAAARDPDRDLGALVDHLSARRTLLEHGVAVLVALAIQRRPRAAGPRPRGGSGLVERAPDDIGNAHHAPIESSVDHRYLMSSRTFSAM